jgi:D-galacturonate reductase
VKVLVVGAGMYVTGRGTDGCGTVLPSLAQASKTLPITHVTVCATSAASRDDVARATARINRELGTSLVVDYRLADEALAAPDADCAIVSVPDDLHHPVARALFERGVHCLIVKPLTPTLAEARELVALQEKGGLIGAVELHKRFDEANQLVRRLVRDGRLGRLSYATVDYSQRIDVPARHFRGWAPRTNIFQYLAVHYVDLLHWITGYLPERAMAIGIDPARSTAMSDQRYSLVGERGRLDCDQKHRGVELATADGVQSINPYFSERLLDGADRTQFAGYGYRSIARFLAEVAGVDDPTAGRSATLRDALVSTAVIEAVNRSLADGAQWRTIDDAT